MPAAHEFTVADFPMDYRNATHDLVAKRRFMCRPHQLPRVLAEPFAGAAATRWNANAYGV